MVHLLGLIMHGAIQRTFHHDPALLEESIAYLVTDPSGSYVDGTLGGGGHSEAILRKLSKGGQLIGIDRDETALEFAKERLRSYSRFQAVHSPFSEIGSVLDSLEIQIISGILLDLGVSSPQIDEGKRGFSYMTDGPLDMRMSAEDTLSAADIVNTYPERELADLIYQYSEERLSRRIARLMVRKREENPIKTTQNLAEIVRQCVPGKHQIKSLSRVFQALRIATNRELDQLRDCLVGCYPYLAPFARVVVITYHSLEARMVKRFFRGDDPSFSREDPISPMPKYHFRILTKKAIVPSNTEIERNPRARSAALRCAERTESP